MSDRRQDVRDHVTALRDPIAAALRDADVARLRAEGRVPPGECPCGSDGDAERARSCRACDSRGEHAGHCGGCADLRPLADLADADRAPYYAQADAVLAVVGPALPALNEPGPALSAALAEARLRGREAAGRAAHARNWLGRNDAARLHTHDGGCSCGGCARWPDLADAQRESFRASQDPALSLLAPLLAECAAALQQNEVAWAALRALPDMMLCAADRREAVRWCAGARPVACDCCKCGECAARDALAQAAALGVVPRSP